MENLTKRKTKASIIALILIVSIVTTLTITVLPTMAQEATEINTFAFILPVPNPIGVDQLMIVTFRVDKVASGATTAGGFFENFTVTITKPNGDIETKGPLTADSTSSGYFFYTPDQIGDYTFQLHFPGQAVSGFSFFTGAFNYYYRPSDSAVVTLTVQADAIAMIPNIPLPNNYWERPVNSANKGWWQVADNFPMKSYDQTGRSFAGSPAIAPYSAAPNSAHILWKTPIYYGGITGGQFGDQSYFTGLSYEQHFDAMIMNGVVFYTEHTSTTTSALGTRFLSLYTGEEVDYLDDTNIAFGQAFDIDNPNEHGLHSYLWETSGSTWTAWDQFTLEPVFTIVNMSGLTSWTTFGPNGELLSYRLNGNTLTMWNSTLCVYRTGFIDTWSPGLGSVWDGPYGIQYSVELPDLPGSQSLMFVNRFDGYLVANTVFSDQYPQIIMDAAIDLNAIQRNSTGQYPETINWMWVQNRTDIEAVQNRFCRIYGEGTDVYTRFDEGRQLHIGYSITTGTELWETPSNAGAFGMFTRSYALADDLLYAAGFDGHVRAFDTSDGTLEWDYFTGSSGLENAYGTYPEYSGFLVADGKVFAGTDEHSPDSVLWRGAKLRAIDAYEGTLVWEIDGYFRHPIVADGILVSLNSYDGQAYAFGRGPSATTVSAPQTAVAKGNSVMITGTVTDQTPATQGTPAISDEDMTAWMEYMHMQKLIPSTAKGVQVKLEAIDSSTGESTEIGWVTSDMSGNFGKSWTPDAEGDYTIVATFEGTQSYGPSFATTYLVVDPAADEILTPLENSVSGLEGSVDSLEGSVSDVEGSVSDLDSSVTGSVTDLETSVNNVAGSVSNLENSVGTLESNTSTLTTYLIAILALVIVAIVIALYSVLKSRK